MAKACCVQGRRRQKAIIPQTINIRKCQHIRLSVESSFLLGRGNRREVETADFPKRRSELVESLKHVHKILTQLFLLKEINLFAQSCNSHRQTHPVSTTWIKKGLLWLPFLHNEGPFPAVTLYLITPLVYFIAQVLLCLFGCWLVCCLSLPLVWTPQVKLLTLPTQCHRIWHIVVSQ